MVRDAHRHQQLPAEARARKKRKHPPIVSRIVTPPKLSRLKASDPAERHWPDQSSWARSQQTGAAEALGIVEPKRKARTSIFGNAPDLSGEELRQRGEAAEAPFREVVRRVRNS
jgi:hypothetical protein